MPRYEITDPSGKRYEITAPEGATQEQVLAYAQQQFAAAQRGRPNRAARGPEAAAPMAAEAPNPANQSDFARMVSGKPRQPTAMQDVKRGAGLTLRYAISGPLEFAGMFTDPIAQQLGLGTAREGAQALGDRLGLPNPQGAGERIVGDVSKAVSGSGGFLGAAKVASGLPGILGRAAGAATAQPVMQGVSAATGSGAAASVREGGGTPGQQTAAGLIGGFFPGAALYTGAAATRGAFRGGEQGRQTMVRSIADFQAAGATPSAGQATGNRRTQGLESLLSGAPTSSGVMARFAERQAQQIGEGLQGRAAGLSPAPSAERAGLAIQRGIEPSATGGPKPQSSFTDRVQGVRSNLYAQADGLIPAGTVTPLANTWAKLRELTTPNPGAVNTTAAMVNPKVAELFQNVGRDLAAAGGKGLPYEAVKEIRSTIGRQLSDFSLAVDRPTAEYKALYAALSRDMEAAAKAQGPAAEAAAKRANDYFRASQARLELLERVVDKAGGPEKVYQAALSGTQDGATTLRAVMRSLPQDGQRALTAAVVKRMGLATRGNQGVDGDTFSAQTFLTNWNSLSREARGALFGPIGAKAGAFGPGGKFVADMDKIARVAERIRNGSKVYANPSGTANRGLAYGYAASLAGAAGAVPTAGAGPLVWLLTAGAGSNVAARLMVNPRFVNWLARSTDLPASAIPQAVASLRAIAKAENDQDMAALADQMSQQVPKAK